MPVGFRKYGHAGNRPGHHLDASIENFNESASSFSWNDEAGVISSAERKDKEEKAVTFSGGGLGEEEEYYDEPALVQEGAPNEAEEDSVTKLERKVLAKISGLEARLRLVETRMDGSSRRHGHRVRGAETPLLDEGEKGEGESVNGLDEKTDDRTEKTLTEDTFSFMITAPSKSTPFWLAIGVFLLQMAVLFLLGINLINFQDASNPFQIPTNVSGAVRLTQFVSLFVAVILQNDLITCFDLMRDGLSQRLMATFHHATKVKFTLVTVCRFVEGSVVLLLMFALIVSSETVIDVLLNFTAVEFVSQFDEAFFFLCHRAYLGKPCEVAAWFILETTYYSPEKKFQRLRKTLLMAIFFVALLIGWGLVINMQVEGILLCSTILVQFGDDLTPELGTFSGYYDKKQPSKGFTLSSQRVEYVERNSGRAKFAYCDDIAAWTFRWEPTPGAGDYDPCDDWKVRSSQTKAFDLTQSIFETWYIQDEFQRQIVLEPFYLSCYDCSASPGGNECTGRGLCEDAVCSCDEGWIGPRCEYVYPCANVATDLRFASFPGAHQWSQSLELLIDSASGKPVEVYNHPVYVNVSESGTFDTIFFTGRRWAATFGDYMPGVTLSTNGTSKDSSETKRVLSEYFQTDFHAYWSDYRVAFLSGPMDHETPEDSNLPVGVQWSYADSQVYPDGGVQAPDIPVDTVLVCSVCNNLTNACRFDGVCNDQGICQCSLGSQGSLCEITPVGNGRCDQFFNSPEFGFDGGDCCDATCTSSSRNWCGTDDNSFTSTGYPFCKLSPQEWLANGDLLVFGKGPTLGYEVALSSSGNTLAVSGELTNGVINVYDKDGSTWRFRSSLDTGSGADYNVPVYTWAIEIFEDEGNYIKNRVSPVPVTVSVFGRSGASTSQRAEAFIFKCDKECNQEALIIQSNSEKGYHSFDMINQHVYGTMETFAETWTFTVTTEFGEVRSFSISGIADSRSQKKMRLADNGNVIGILSVQVPLGSERIDDVYFCASFFSWDGRDYIPKGSEVCLNQTIRADLELGIPEASASFALARDDGDVFAIMACGLKQVHLFEWNGIDEWIPREPPMPNATIQCVLKKRNFPYVKVEMSGDGLVLALSGVAGEEFADEVLTRVFKWTNSSWKELGPPLLGGNSFSLSRNGLVAAVGSFENLGFDSVAVYSRPAFVCASGISTVHFSLTTDDDFLYWVMLDAETREILVSGLARPSYRTVAADVCLDVEQRCVEVAILDRQQQQDGISSPGGYALYLNDTRLSTESFGSGYMKQSWIGNCSVFSNTLPCAEAEGTSNVEIAAIMENGTADNLTWQLLDYYSRESVLEGGPYFKNTTKFLVQQTCLDLANSCFVFNTRNGYKRGYNGTIQDNIVDLVVDSRSVHNLSVGEWEYERKIWRNSVYIGPNGCCPTGTSRIQIAFSTCNNTEAVWTVRMPNGTLIAAGEYSAEIMEPCDFEFIESHEWFWEDLCIDEKLCYQVQTSLNVFPMSTFPDIDLIDQSDFPFREGFMYKLGKCEFYAGGAEPIVPDPISLTDGAALSDQSSACPGCAQELRLYDISPGDIVTCMLEGANGDADLHARFGGVPLFGENPAVRNNDCWSETIGISRESCTTRPARKNENFLDVVVFARATYTDLTIQCSVIASQPPIRDTEAPSITAFDVETDEPSTASSTQPHAAGSIVPSLISFSTSEPSTPSRFPHLSPTAAPSLSSSQPVVDTEAPSDGFDKEIEPTGLPLTAAPSLSSSQPVVGESTVEPTDFPTQSSRRPTADLTMLPSYDSGRPLRSVSSLTKNLDSGPTAATPLSSIPALSSSSDPVYLLNGIALPGQSSASVGSVQEYRLVHPIASGDIGTCTLKGDNGNADLFVQFGEPNVFVDGSSGCHSAQNGSNESCTTSATSPATFLRAVVVAKNSYSDVTILCSVDVSKSSSNSHNRF